MQSPLCSLSVRAGSHHALFAFDVYMRNCEGLSNAGYIGAIPSNGEYKITYDCLR